MRAVPPCDAECVIDALGPSIFYHFSALALIALHCDVNIPFLGFVGCFMGQDFTEAGGELLAGAGDLK